MSSVAIYTLMKRGTKAMTQAEERVATDGESARDANETRRSEARKLITERRSLALASASIDSKIRINGRWANFADTNARNSFVKDNPYIGLALSGGGIRSATISLGLVESLAAQGRFYGFDMMSTVSGGGYFGSFLRALFVERAPDDGMEENKAIVTDRIACANATLLSLPDQQFFRGAPHSSAFVREGLSIKNPLWWLRENGRYLAPGGMSDYGYALAYIVRNWLTLQICLLAALMLGFARSEERR